MCPRTVCNECDVHDCLQLVGGGAATSRGEVSNASTTDEVVPSWTVSPPSNTYWINDSLPVGLK